MHSALQNALNILRLETEIDELFNQLERVTAEIARRLALPPPERLH